MANEGPQPLSPHWQRTSADSAEPGQAGVEFNGSILGPNTDTLGFLWLPGKGLMEASGSALHGLQGAAGKAGVWQQRAL